MLLSLALGTAFAAVGVELGVRACWQLPPELAMFEQAGLFVAEADGGAGLAPGYVGMLHVGRDLDTCVRINALGMRGDEIGAPRPGERRLLVVGDSLVFGYGVEQQDALPAVLGEQLGAAAAVSVGNGGVPGFGTRDSARRLAALDRVFTADAFVFCSFLGNDALDDLRDDAAVCGGLRFTGHQARLVRESLRFRLMLRSRALLWLETWIYNNAPSWSPQRRLTASPTEVAVMAGLPGAYPEYGRTYGGVFLDVADELTTWSPASSPVVPRILANVRGSLQRAREVAAGRPLVFVVLPSLWLVDEARRLRLLADLRFEPAAFPRGTAQRRWLEVARQLDVTAVDVTAALAAVVDPKSLYVDAGAHFNRRGAEIVCREIAAAVRPLLR